MMAANMDNTKPPHGVYKNPRFMHACTTIVGYTVHLQTKDGSIWEGILETFSPDFTVCLYLAVPIDPKLNSKDCLYAALSAGLQVKERAFFDLKDIVRITAIDVDLNYATKDLAKLATDADISGYDANKSTEQKQLESWQDEDGDNANSDSLLSLDDVALAGNKNHSQNNSRGWDADEMFSYNEKVHKVTSTFDEKLTDYTLPLPKHNTKEWRKKHDRAVQIAIEIEGNSKSQGRLAKEDEGDEEEKYSAVHRPVPNRLAPNIGHQNQNGTHNKNFRPRNFDRARIESHRNFAKNFNLVPSPRQPQQPQQQKQPQQQQPQQPQQPQPQHPQQPQQQQPQQQQPQPLQPAPHQQPAPTQQSQAQAQTQTQAEAQTQAQTQVIVTTASPPTTTSTSTVNASTISERSDTSSGSQAKDHQSELARKSKLNPNAKEFVYKPRSPAASQRSQTNGANQASTSGAPAIYPTNSSPMSHAPYYQQVPMFPHGLSPHQQQHHAAQFMPNHVHPHFQNQIHYMSPVPPHFAQQMSQRYIRGNFQNYHHRGEHHNNVRADYSQASMMAPTSTGQPFVPPPSGAPHPMNAYAASPQQPMIYSGPPQSMYPVVQAGFPQHMPHVMPNPPPYDGSTVYMPSQNYIVNP